MVWSSRRRERVQHAVAAKGISIRLVCELFLFSQTCYRYDAKRNVGNEAVANWLTRLTDNKRNWGLCYLYLRSVKGFKWNHKCIIAFTVSLSRSAHQTQETWCVRNWKHWRFQRQSIRFGRWISCMTNWKMARALRFQCHWRLQPRRTWYQSGFLNAIRQGDSLSWADHFIAQQTQGDSLRQ